jgi:hypothetical protein
MTDNENNKYPMTFAQFKAKITYLFISNGSTPENRAYRTEELRKLKAEDKSLFFGLYKDTCRTYDDKGYKHHNKAFDDEFLLRKPVSTLEMIVD